MDFYEVLDQVIDLLRSRGRVTYRALKLQFKLDDESLETLKDEIIKAQRWPLRSFGAHRLSLEDTFLELTRASLGDGRDTEYVRKGEAA